MDSQPAPCRAVVITGASTGIGKACALHLDKLGYKVFAGVRQQADAETLQQQASAQLVPLFIDVTDVEAIHLAANTVAAAAEKSGLAGLVNNAGIAVGSPLEFLPIAQLRSQLEINVIGQIAATQAFLPLLRRAKGRIINMSSISGRIAMPFVGPYAASKFALEALTDSLRVELKPWGIEVISIQPGAIDTPIWDKSINRADIMRHNFAPEAEQLYGPLMSVVRRSMIRAGQSGISAEKVAQIVARALATPRPKTRYVVGKDAKLASLLVRFLPDRLRDWLILQATWQF